MSSTVTPILEGVAAESELEAADRPGSVVVERALPGSSIEIFCSKAERLDWLAEKILSMSEICVRFRLCSADPEEMGKTCSDRTSVWWGTRALSGGSVEIVCSKAEHFD